MQQNLEAGILETLDKWERHTGPLPEILVLYRDVLLVQHKVKTSLNLPPLCEQLIKERFSQGIPFVSFEDLGIERSELTSLFSRILKIVEDRLVLSAADLSWLKKLASDDKFLFSTARKSFEGKAVLSQYPGVDAEIFTVSMQASLWPWLSLRAESLKSDIDQSAWRKPHCPVCGGKPDFSYLAAGDGSRWLSCFRCDSEWLFQRLACPFCTNMDQKELDCYSDDLCFHRMEVCHKCGTYIKSIDFRKAEGDVLLPLEKVMAVNLSWEDQDRFRPGWI